MYITELRVNENRSYVISQLSRIKLVSVAEYTGLVTCESLITTIRSFAMGLKVRWSE